MNITKYNYFSKEAQMHYMGVSQFKAFEECEAKALAEIKGEWEIPKTTPLLVGSYVDAYFENDLELFKENYPQVFKKDGSLKKDYVQAERIIKRLKRDKLFMEYLNGKKQVIATGAISGIPVKIKIDALHNDKIVDLKVMKDFSPMWKDGEKHTFVQAWGYDLQGAVYQFIEGNNKPFFIAAATKEKETDLILIHIPQEFLNERLGYFKGMAPRYANIKKGIIKPVRCERCDYCKSTKVLNKVVDLRDLIYEME